MVTSALPGEGKSTLTRHLACALAKVENVLLLECDLRRPSLQETFQLEQSPGLIQLLLGEAKFADCINLGVRDNLDVMTAGGSSMNPLELLGSPRFYHLMAQMEKRYDRILIDSAPVQAVSDALLLGQVADNVLFAVKANTTPARVAARAVERLRDASVSVSGAVVTQVKVNNSMISYDNFDYEGYYDYYGYSTQESTAGVRKKKKKAAKNKEVKAA
jgi:capsular exopolysaccharide synthesis family protein